MNKIQSISFSLAVLTISLLLSSVAANGQTLSAEQQKQEQCRNNKNQIAFYERQARESNQLASVFKREQAFRALYSTLNQAIANGRILEGVKNQNNRQRLSDLYVLELDTQGVTDPMTFQKAMRDKMQQLLDKTLQYSNADEIQADLENAIRQIQFHKDRLVILRCDSVEGSNWAGTYVANEKNKITISGADLSLSAVSVWDASYDNGSKGTDNWSNCEQVASNKVECKWDGEQSDNDKTTTRRGRVEATLNGDTLEVKYTEDEPTFKWKGGKPLYQSKMQKGAIWTGTYKRKN